MTSVPSEGAEARRLASERGISVGRARRIVRLAEQKRRAADRQARGVKLYQFLPLSPKHRVLDCGGEYPTDDAAVEACAARVARDGINRQQAAWDA